MPSPAPRSLRLLTALEKLVPEDVDYNAEELIAEIHREVVRLAPNRRWLVHVIEDPTLLDVLVTTARVVQAELAELNTETRTRRMRVAVRHVLGGKARIVFDDILEERLPRPF